jgi:mannose-1-phosphate guanylyltransferase
MHENYYAVIMAGGGGTRLWPLSRHDRPKQMLRLGSERTLFQLATDRLQGLFPPERILVVTVAEQAAQLQQQDASIPAENYLIEPTPRGTASVVGLAAAVLQKRDPQAVMAVLTADHSIKNVDAFRAVLRRAYSVAEQGYLVTLGIPPAFPSTGSGYIQRGLVLESDVYEVRTFKEKPNEATARQFLAAGDHDWNSGMFIWRVERILDEFARQMPELAATLAQIGAAWGTPAEVETVQALWPAIRPQTIDYGIMEHAQRVAVLPAQDLGWSDVGSWESVIDVLPAGEQGNRIVSAEHLGLDTRDTLVISDQPGRLIVTIGIADLVIVDTGDALLVTRRDQSQRVKEIVQKLKDSGQSDRL